MACSAVGVRIEHQRFFLRASRGFRCLESVALLAKCLPFAESPQARV
jgi:hypothetical protein